MPAASHATALEALYPGALLALAAWHAAAFAVRRDRAHGLCAGFVASLALSLAAWDGLVPSAPGLGAGASGRSALVAIDATAALFAALLTRTLLCTGRDAPRLDPLLRALAVLSAVALPLAAPATWALGMEIVGLVSLAGPPILFAAGVVAWRAGSAPARPYLAAHACVLAGLLVEATPGRGADEAAAWAAHGAEAGALAMVLALSRGVAVRRRALAVEAERVDAERRALETADHDPATGLWSRQHLDDHLQHVWRRALREGTPVSLLRVDVDGFGAFDDARGRPAGDECLRRVAHALASAADGRHGFLIARHEGDAFAAVLPGLAGDAAFEVAESVRAAVAALGIPHPGPTATGAPHVTVAIGVATLVPDEGELEAKRLCDGAEQALRAAKRDGGDRVARLG